MHFMSSFRPEVWGQVCTIFHMICCEHVLNVLSLFWSFTFYNKHKWIRQVGSSFMSVFREIERDDCVFLIRSVSAMCDIVLMSRLCTLWVLWFLHYNHGPFLTGHSWASSIHSHLLTPVACHLTLPTALIQTPQQGTWISADPSAGNWRSSSYHGKFPKGWSLATACLQRKE